MKVNETLCSVKKLFDFLHQGRFESVYRTTFFMKLLSIEIDEHFAGSDL